MSETFLCQEKRSVPPVPPHIRLVALNARYIHSCLALFYIRNELAIHLPEAEVDLLQLTINDNSHESLLRITEDEPFAVFFSAAIWNSELVVQLAGDVRACLPECRIVVGGPEAGVLERKLPPRLCSVVLGEIEAVDAGFYQDLLFGQLKPRYQGSFFRLQNLRLDDPFREEDFAGELLNRHVYYESSRGCPYNCSYCLSASERGLYHKGLEQVQTELRRILAHNPKVVRFVDRTFNDSPARALAIWSFLLEQDCDTLFHFEIAPDRFSEEMFDLLKVVPPGRFQFEIGIQSFNRETLEAIHRRMDLDKVSPIIRRLAALGTIHLHVDLILGLPYETAESFADSFRAVFTMGAHYIQMGLLKILPDTPICHGAGDYGYVHSSHPPYAVFASNWLRHTEMRHLYWFCESVEKFHNNRFFVSLWRHLRSGGEDVFAFFRKLLDEGEKVGLLHRAATQEALCRVVLAATAARPDNGLIRDLLRYDWLRCGYRRLPDCLLHQNGEESTERSRDILFRTLPDELAGIYSAQSRNHFFKRSVFLRLSGQAAEVLGFGQPESGLRIAVLQEREQALHEHNKVLRFAEIADGYSD